ncbi:MAG: FMN-binding protein [Clostridia bacterium]|nr:FMN-binding protein [Clostridia bacterium]
MANNNLRELMKDVRVQYAPGAPLMLEACALYADANSGRCIAQMKWKNLEDKPIRAVGIVVNAMDAFGHSLEFVEYQYADVRANPGDSFGSRSAVLLKNPNVRSFAVAVKAVSFEDGSMFSGQEDNWYAVLPEKKAIALTGDLLAQYKRDLRASGYAAAAGKYEPQISDDLWQCGCGNWQKRGQTVCIQCHATRRALMAAANPETLAANLVIYEKEQEEKRIAEEKAAEEERAARALAEAQRKRREEEERIAYERRRAAEEERRQEERRKRNKRNLAIACCVLLAAGAGCAAKFYLIPNSRYEAAAALMEKGQYAQASAAFAQIGDFKDAADMVNGVYYVQAEALLAAGEYEAASQAFEQAGSYKDAASRVLEPYYKQAEALLANADYHGAAHSFALAGDYSDAAERILEPYYVWGDAQLAAGDMQGAVEAFTRAVGYKDADERILQIRYAQAEALLAEGKEDEAYIAFDALVWYSDAAERAYNIRLAQAERLIAAGDYDGAADVYTAIGASDKANETMYACAQALYDQGDVVKAAAVFLKLEDYSDARDRHYQIGTELAGKGEYASAIEVLSADIAYEDAQEQVYLCAKAASDAQDYAVSVVGYEAVGAYKDSAMNLTMDTYAYGEQLYAAGEFDKAADVFAGMNGFSDTAERVKICKYDAAKRSLESGDYQDARDRFAALGNYSDSAKMVQEAQYRAANEMFENGSYESALSVFSALGGYSDSGERVLAAKYAIAAQQYNQGDYEAAAKGFEAIRGYSDAETQWKAARYAIYAGDLAAQRFDQAIEGFEALDDYGDSAMQAKVAHYGKAESLAAAQDHAGAYSEYLLAGDYQDAEQQVKVSAYSIAQGMQEWAEYAGSVAWYEIAADYADSVAQLYKIGEFYFSTQDYLHALDAFKTIAGHEKAAEYLYRIGQYYEMQADMPTAIKAYHYANGHADSLQKQDTLASQLLTRAQGSTAMHDYKTALDIYTALDVCGMDVMEPAREAEFFAFLTEEGRKFTFGSYHGDVTWRSVGVDGEYLIAVADTAMGCAKYEYSWYSDDKNVDAWLKDFKKKSFSSQEASLLRYCWIFSHSEVNQYLPEAEDRIVNIPKWVQAEESTSSTYAPEGVWTSTEGHKSSYTCYIAYDNKTGAIDTWGSLDFKGNYVRPSIKIKMNVDLMSLLLGGNYHFYDANGKEVFFESAFNAQGKKAIIPAAEVNAPAETAPEAASIESVSIDVTGFQPFTVEIETSNGKIVSVKVPSHNETPGFGADLIGSGVLDTLVGQDIATAQIDMKSGVTFTSNAINDALRQAGKGAETATPATDAVGPYGVTGTYTGTGMGFMGDITAVVTIENGWITDVSLTGNETKGIGSLALEEMPERIVEAQSADIHMVSGATLSSRGIIEAVEDALGQI